MDNTTELPTAAGHEEVVLSKERAPRRPNGLTELQRLTEFVEENSDGLAYRPDTREWLSFGGSIWRVDEDAVRAHELARASTQAAFDELDPHHQAAVEHKWLTLHFPSRLIHAATKQRDIRIEGQRWDAHANLLGCSNGIIDLRSGRLITGSPDLLVSRSTEVEFDPDAQCPRFERFLDEVQPNSPDVRRHLQHMAGYLLTGETSLQKMWLFYGQGANGKTVLVETLLTLLGEYGQKGPRSVMLGRETHGGPRTDLTRIEGARLVALSETDRNDAFSEARLKELTGGERIAARALYQSEVEFTPQAKFVLTTNDLPRVQGTDEGIWRRLIVVPFEQNFTNPDPKLLATLRSELPGILAWAVRGAVEFYAAGQTISTPAALTRAGKSYRADQDTLNQFLEDRCMLTPGAFVPSEELKAAYATWCKENDHSPLPWQQTVAQQLHSRGLKREKRGKANRWCWVGVGLAPNARRDDSGTELTVAA